MITQSFLSAVRKNALHVLWVSSIFTGAIQGQTPTTTTFTTAGAHTWTAPCGVRSITVECWGGGGAGGGATAANPAAGGGGSGGAYTSTTYTVVPGTTYNLHVGAGGAGTTGAGGAGGASWFNSNTSVLAVGGAGGTNATTTTPAAGAAAVTAGNIGGTTNYYGGAGGTGATNATAGGGGSSAGSASNGNNATSGTGGAAVTGGGAGANGQTGNAAGTAGTAPGGGGGGARRTSRTRAGGAGAIGKVAITYTSIAPAAPTAPNVSGLTPTSATLGWTAPAGTITSYTVRWRVLSSATWDTITNILSTSYLLTGLTSNTTYSFEVTDSNGSPCGGPYSRLDTFTTPCATVTLPLAEGFNYTTIPPGCWTTQNVTGASAIKYVAASTLPTTVPQEGTDFVWWNARAYAPGNKTRLVTPPILTTGTASVDISFYWYNENNPAYSTGNYLNEGVTVEYSLNGTTWTAVQFYPRHNSALPSGTGAWQQEYLTLPAAVGNQAQVYVGFLFTSERGDNCSFDHLNIFPTPDCAGVPSTAIATGITPYTATISWTASPAPPADGYIWRIVPAGDSVNGVAVDSGTTAAGVDSVQVTGLSSSTRYDVYVQSNCGSPLGVGSWRGPTTFVTLCAPISVLPWHEGFESLGIDVGAGILPPCWLPRPTLRWITSDVPIANPPVGPRAGTNYMYERFNAKDTVYTPGFDLTGGTAYQFYFYYQTDGQAGWDSIYAMYGTSQSPSGMAWQIGPVVTAATNTTYQLYSAIFTPAATGTYYFGVKLYSAASPDVDIAFDDFGLQEYVPCGNPPQGGTISGPASVCPGTAVNLSLTGYTPFTALQWQTSSDSAHFYDLVGANQDVINSIIYTTSYFRVKVLCADSVYSPVYPVYQSSPTVCYCSAGLGGVCADYNIDTLSILATNFYVANEPCHVVNGSAYTAFPATGTQTTTLQRGGSYTVSINIQAAAISSAWIDYNQDGVYEASEWVQITTNAKTGTATLTVPANAALGLTGFRVRTNRNTNTNGATDACTTFTYGETFQFYITIADTVCSQVPTVSQSITNVQCYGDSNGSVTLTAITGNNGPYAHRWYTGDTSSTLAHLPAGIYANTITFDNGCTYTWTGDTVTQLSSLVASVDSIHHVGCFGDTTGAIYVSASGGTSVFTSHWSSGDTTPDLTGKPSGAYVDTISDGNGCRVILGPDSITGPSAALAIRIDSIISVKCNGQSNGAIYITASGGTLPYQYSWSNATGDSDLLNVPAGGYTVNIADSNGCAASRSDSVPQPGVLTITTDSVINATCHSSSDGSIYIHVTGGTLVFNYDWTGGYHTFNLYLKPAGIYTLTITDTNNCTASVTDTITAPPALTATTTATDQIVGSGAGLGSISASVSGGVPPYTYIWSNGDTTGSISNLTSGEYFVTITDQNGCSTYLRNTVNLIVNSIAPINGDAPGLMIYPNPSSGILNAQVAVPQNAPVRLEVYSVTGELIPVPITHEQAGIYQIDMSEQPPGLYLIKLIAGDYSAVRRVTLIK